MSIHGICFDNGQSGKCDSDCEIFQHGDCEVADDVILGEYEFFKEQWSQALIDELFKSKFGEVQLWALRHGEKLTDLELFTKLHGY